MHLLESNVRNGIHLVAVIAISNLALYFYLNARFRLKEQSYEKNIQIQRENREKERLGRISVQKRSRDQGNQIKNATGYVFKPIGHFLSPFPDRRGAPRQPMLVPAARGIVKFDRNIIQFEHFQELQEFSHIWVIFVFHENTNSDTMDTVIDERNFSKGKRI